MVNRSLTVIISTDNTEKNLEECLHRLGEQRGAVKELEIIVVDGGSTDKTIDIARRAGAHLVEYRDGNVAKARNQAIHEATGEVICFTNGDCLPAEDWIEAITAPLHDPAIVGVKGVYTSQQRNPVARFIQLEYEEKYDRLGKARSVDFVDGYSAAYRCDVLASNHGFDERFNRLEDQELSYRLASRGYRLVFEPSARVQRQHTTSISGYMRTKFRNAAWQSQVIRRFPGQAFRDSYTPQSIKIQLVIMAALVVSAFMGLFSSKVLLPVLLLLTGFFFSTVPFILRAWKQDRKVALLSPVLLLLRAASLGFGYAYGTIRFISSPVGGRVTIGGFHYLVKRLIDLVGALAGILCLILVVLPVSLAIRLTSRGPVIYSQKRVGQSGKIFTMYKFRTMIEGAENMDRESRSHEDLVYKTRYDPRVTGIGKFLRRWSLDELPQFWNVLVGEMSLVGPRPEEPAIVASYSDFQRRRLAVKPGMTGPMQVSGRADLTLDERVRLEIGYIENYSILDDLVILARTLPAVALGRGAW